MHILVKGGDTNLSEQFLSASLVTKLTDISFDLHNCIVRHLVGNVEIRTKSAVSNTAL